MSDCGPQFVARFTRELYCLLRIELAPSTAYHPQTNGQTERVNQEMEQFLRLFVNERQDDWDELLPLAEFSYNNHVHSLTQQTPFMADTGRNPWMGLGKTIQKPPFLVETRGFRGWFGKPPAYSQIEFSVSGMIAVMVTVTGADWSHVI